MAALRDFFLFLLRKTGYLLLAFGVLTVIGFLVFRVLPKAKDYEAALLVRQAELADAEKNFRRQLEDLSAQAEPGIDPKIAIERLEERVAVCDQTIRRLEQRREALWFYQWADRMTLDGKIEVVKLQREAAALALRNIHEAQRVKKEIEARIADIADRMAATARERQNLANSWEVVFFAYVRDSWITTLWILLTLALAPVAWKSFWFYGIGPLFNWLPPLQLAAEPEGEIRVGESLKSKRVQLQPGERLLVRMGWAPQTSDREIKKTRLLGIWRAPLISYAAGLFELTELRPREGMESHGIVLSSGKDADKYMVDVELKNHPGFVFRPRHLVAIQEDEKNGLKLVARWRLFSLHSLFTWQFRYILFSGTGRIYLSGLGGLESGLPSDSEHRIDQHLVAGFDARLKYSVRRSETFWPYLRGRASLTDDCFSGDGGLYLRNVATDAAAVQTVIERSTGGLLNAIGKLLGF